MRLQRASRPFRVDMALAIDDHIQTVLTSPAGKRQDVERALRWAVGRIALANTPDELYEVRKDLRAAAHGRYNEDIPSLRLAKRELEDVIGVVDDVIESAAPGYKAYLKQYNKMQSPIGQMFTLQGLREHGTVMPQISASHLARP